MRLLHLAAGAGQMYCGACARDVALLRGLMAQGHDVQIVPLYTPLRIEGDDPPVVDPVFMGGINAFLQQQSALFRHLPPWLDRWLDNPALLRFVSRFAISTKPSELGPMTVSVLAGKGGSQRKELDRLTDYLAGQPAPDVISITNSMLSGVAPELKRRFGKPIVCGFQGEDGFLESMGEPHVSRAWDLLRRNAESVDLFIAPGQTHAAKMAARLGLAEGRIRIIPTPLDAALYRRDTPRLRDPFTIAYLSVVTPVKGLDLLVEACRLLRESADFPFRLRVAGRVLNSKYRADVQAQVAAAGLQDRFEFLDELDTAAKVRFFHEASVFVLPTRATEARGVVVMEAQAAALPAIVPATGVFPELADRAPCITVPPEDPKALAQALRQIAQDPDQADALGLAAAQGIQTHYSPEATTRDLTAALTSLL